MPGVAFVLDDLDDDHFNGQILGERINLTCLPHIGHEIYFEAIREAWKTLQEKQSPNLTFEAERFVVRRIVLDVVADEYQIWIFVPTCTVKLL